MKPFALFVAGLVALTVSVGGVAEAAGSAATLEAARSGAATERVLLFDGKIERVWATAESDASLETNRVPAGARALHWHIKVDHLGGEPKYPVGWPRLWRALQGAERDWSGYDYLVFRVLADTSREKLPRTPVTLLLRMEAAEGSWSRPLAELKKGEWVPYVVPIAGLPKPEAVQQIMFSISDADYRHQDEVHFIIADLALERFAAPTLLEFAPEQGVLFADTASLAVRLRVSGLKSGERAEVVCEMKRNGQTVSRATVTAERGAQRVVLKPGEQPWAAGAYELAGSIGGGPAVAAPVRLVDSPWTERKIKP
jgi:hypothetical protein